MKDKKESMQINDPMEFLGGFVKSEALRPLQTKLSKTTFEEDIKHKNHVLLLEFIHRISLKALHMKRNLAFCNVI